jgi:hypothetical protein
MCVNNICRTCKHWDVTHVDNKIRQTIEIEIDQGSGWDSGGASVEEVCTPAHFGCNHWEHWNPA